MKRDPETGRFLPGESGNPDHKFKPGGPGGPGRPRSEVSLIKQLRTRLLEPAVIGKQHILDEHGNPQTFLEFLTDRVIINAARGNSRALQEIIERLDGKVTQKLSLQGGDGPPISVTDARSELDKAIAALGASKPQRKRPKAAPKKAQSRRTTGPRRQG